jgi:hypothetical protein
MLVTHMIDENNEHMDFFPLPIGGDKSGIYVYIFIHIYV